MYACATCGAEVATPLCVDFSLEVECAHLVGEIAWYANQGEGDPEEEGVDGEEAAVVEEDACPTDEGGEEADGGGEGGGDEFGAVADADDVCVCPDVEPGEEAEDEGDEGVGGDLRGEC